MELRFTQSARWWKLNSRRNLCRPPGDTNRGSANRLASRGIALMPVRNPLFYSSASSRVHAHFSHFRIISIPPFVLRTVQFNLVPPTTPSKPWWLPSLIVSQRYVPIHSACRGLVDSWPCADPIGSRSPTSRSMEASIPTNSSRLRAV